ncbi:Serine/threonine protein kinase HT1 [Entamoeba marina]
MLLFLFVSSCLSQCFPETTDGDITTFDFDSTNGCTSSGYISYVYDFMKYYTFDFDSGLESRKVIIGLNDPDGDQMQFINIQCSSNNPKYLDTIQIKDNATNLYDVHIYTENFNNYSHSYYGCFDETVFNAKLTDFGSSRNMNMLMANMTFTKYVGSPAYMAPEVNKKQVVKKEADIFSFAITMYETFKWGKAYKKPEFVYPYQIYEFVRSGKRLPKLKTVGFARNELIRKCWVKNPAKRFTIEQILEAFETIDV